jgi:hypothetical protein
MDPWSCDAANEPWAWGDETAGEADAASDVAKSHVTACFSQLRHDGLLSSHCACIRRYVYQSCSHPRDGCDQGKDGRGNEKE